MIGTGQRVLVTGARLPAALEIARGLRAIGAEVWAADSLRMTPTGASRSVNGYVRFPSPALHPAEFRAAVLASVRTLGITLIVPVSEEIFFLAQMREELPAGTALFAPSLPELEALHSKFRLLRLAAECGARIPQTVRVESVAQLREEIARQPDSVLKPEYSRGAYQARFPPHVDLSDMEADQFPLLVQERVSGREISSFAVTSNGRVLACASYLPRFRTGAGASLYFEPISSPTADAFVAKFVSRNHTTGQLGFDFMQSPEGEFTLLECNPRATSGVHLLANHESWASVYLGEVAPANPAMTPRCSKFGVVMMHALPNLLRGAFNEMRADLRRAHDTCYRAGDSRPSFAQPLCSLEIALRSIAWPVKAKHAYTFDLEWNGETR